MLGEKPKDYEPLYDMAIQRDGYGGKKFVQPGEGLSVALLYTGCGIGFGREKLQIPLRSLVR